MKTIALSLLFGMLTMSAWGFRTVIIDAGHGGNDRGGSWGKVYEKHLALDTAFRLDSNAIFVSIHINKASRTGAAGIETFYYGSEGRKLGSAIQKKMVSKVKVEDRGLKYARFHVLRKTKIPAVLTEIGFVSNYGDRQRLKSGHYRDAVAKAIADGIAQYD